MYEQKQIMQYIFVSLLTLSVVYAYMKCSCYLVVVLEVVALEMFVIEWRYQRLVKEWSYPPESDKTVPLVSNAV